MKPVDQLALAWLGFTSSVAFLMFGWDKWRATKQRERVSEWRLVLVGAVGGWLGGLLAMLLLRHKTVKLAFQVKYALGFLVWVGLIFVWLRWR